ncbi:hypothetical protein RCL1_007752 [Eukaryota sp. TZLM3-RCL]
MDILTARQARDHFSRGQFQEALSLLQQLPNHQSDPQIQHNIALCKFYLSGNATAFYSSISTLSVDSPILLYNTAVSFYHQWKFQEAINTIQPLLASFDSLTDSLKQAVAILLVESNMALGKLDQIASALDLLASLFSSDQEHPSVTDLTSPVTSFPLHQSSFSVLHSLYRCQKVLSFPASAPHLFTLLKTVKKELKSILARVPEQSVLGSIARWLKAHLEFRKGSLRKCMKILHGCPWHSLPSCVVLSGFTEIVAFSNLAATYHAFGKAHLAVSYASRALSVLTTSPVPSVPADVIVTCHLNMISLLFSLPPHNNNLPILTLPFSSVTTTFAALQSCPEAKLDPSLLLSHAIACLHAAVQLPSNESELEQVLRDGGYTSDDVAELANNLINSEKLVSNLIAVLSNRSRIVSPTFSKMIGSRERKKVVAYSPGIFSHSNAPVVITFEPRVALENCAVPPIKSKLISRAMHASMLALQLLQRVESTVTSSDVTEKEAMKCIWPSLKFSNHGHAGDAAEHASEAAPPEAFILDCFNSLVSCCRITLAFAALSDNNPALALSFLPPSHLSHAIGNSTITSTVVLQVLYRSEALVRLGQDQQARTELDKVKNEFDTMLPSERVSLLNQLSACWLSSGNPDDVETAYSLVQHARSICPHSAVTISQLTYCALRLHRFSEAASVWVTRGLPSMFTPSQ